MRLVVFTPNGARVHEGASPSDIPATLPYLIDPKIPRGVPPHHWKLFENRIVQMTDEEKKKMDDRISRIPIPHPHVIFSAGIDMVPILNKIIKWNKILSALLAATIFLDAGIIYFIIQNLYFHW
jgi:hypothetical protein